MRYSVWNAGTRRFDYFDAAGELSTNAAKPEHLRSRTLGSTVEQAAWPLPSGAIAAGSGDVAMGRVAVTAAAKRSAMAGISEGGTLGTVALVAAGALAAKLLFGRGAR